MAPHIATKPIKFIELRYTMTQFLIRSIIPCPTNMVSVRVNFLGRFYLRFSLVFHDFEGFLIKKLFHSRFLDMR